MDARELRIGDWFLFGEARSNQDGDYSLWFVPKQMDWDFIKFTIDNDWDELDWEEFTDTIPLTPKILDLNCIDYDEDMQTWYIQDGCCLVFEMQEKEVPYVFGDHAVIRYIHELQYILRLCGLKELADNFKVE